MTAVVVSVGVQNQGIPFKFMRSL